MPHIPHYTVSYPYTAPRMTNIYRCENVKWHLLWTDCYN